MNNSSLHRRVIAADNAYAAGHFLLVAGVIYLALGLEQVLAHVVHNQPARPAGTPLDWTATTVLYGGVVVYLTGRVLFLRFAVGHTPPAQIVAAGVTPADARARSGIDSGYERVRVQPLNCARLGDAGNRIVVIERHAGNNAGELRSAAIDNAIAIRGVGRA